MRALTLLVRQVAGMLLGLLQFLMLAMAIMSWIPQLRQSRLYGAVAMVLEPLLMPIRKLLWRIPALRSFPLDLSFLLLYLLLMLVSQLI